MVYGSNQNLMGLVLCGVLDKAVASYGLFILLNVQCLSCLFPLNTFSTFADIATFYSIMLLSQLTVSAVGEASAAKPPISIKNNQASLSCK